MRYAAVTLFVFFTAIPALPQDTSGAINGRILDAARAAIPSAEVIATHTETGAVRRAITDAEGVYIFQALPIGGFHISVSHPGFQRASREGIELHVNDRLTVNVQC